MTGGEPTPILLQVVPPGRGGVRDYAECLQGEWSRAGVPSSVLALGKGDGLLARIQERAPGRMPVRLVLHFSGYGYAQRGLCFWLLRELADLRQAKGRSLRLVVVFHELFAWGPPWRSAFWVSGAQAWIAHRLTQLADAMWTNTAKHADWLQGMGSGHTPLQARPVFSNVGEPAQPMPIADRAPHAVVFGSAPTRARAFAALQGLEPALKALGVQELVEAGSGDACAGAQVSIATRHAGMLDTEALGQLLLSSRFGLVDYAAHGLAKSGVFAAYAAHGCVTLNTSPITVNGDGLLAGTHYLALPHLTPRVPGLQTTADHLHRWYQGHLLADQADELLGLAGHLLRTETAPREPSQ